MKDPIKCIIVDDEPLAINIIKRYIEKIEVLQLVDTFENALDAFESLKSKDIDLIFLDINMPIMSGIEFVNALHDPPGIIFTTAHRDYAVESYELNVIDYLLKPISFTRFFQSVDKFLALRTTESKVVSVQESGKKGDHFMFVNSNKKNIKIIFDNITHIESIKDYIKIHLKEKTIVTKEKISDFDEILPSQFLRIHRSFIINKDKITAFSSTQIELDKVSLPIGQSYKREVMSLLS